MNLSYGERSITGKPIALAMRLSARDRDDSGFAAMPDKPAALAYRGARAAKGSEVTHTRSFSGLMLVKIRKINPPFVGRVGNASVCSRSLRFFHGRSRPSSSMERKLA